MTSRSHRFILWLFALVLISSLSYKGHCTQNRNGSAVAFLPLTTSKAAVRIKGNVIPKGIYLFPDGITLGAVINVTVPRPDLITTTKLPFAHPLKSGAIINVNTHGQSNYEVSVTYMKAKERMVLGIPLDLALMDEDDWDAIPGIGPKTAKDIIKFRQDNDGFRSLESLKNVHGISEGKIDKIRKFF